MTPERMEEICQILIVRIKEGKGLGSSPGVTPSGHFLPGKFAARFRTMSLAKVTGVSAEELEEFRASAPPEMKERINQAK